jgi:hypothetical protein
MMPNNSNNNNGQNNVTIDERTAHLLKILDTAQKIVEGKDIGDFNLSTNVLLYSNTNNSIMMGPPPTLLRRFVPSNQRRRNDNESLPFHGNK